MAALLLAVAGCDVVLDESRARTCRTIVPAIEGAQSDIRIVASRNGSAPNSIRIDYDVSDGARTQVRQIACRFGSDPVLPSRDMLVAVTSHRGAMGEASLMLLRRFYLEAPGAAPPDPGRQGVAPPVPAPQMVAIMAQAAISAAPAAAIYALIAAGYALVYGLIGRIVFGFGDIAALGGYATLIGVTLLVERGATLEALGLGLMLSLAAGAAHGAAGARLAIMPTLRGGPHATLIASTGLMLAFAEYLRLSQGSSVRWLRPILAEPIALAEGGGFVVTITTIQALTAVLALAIGTGLVAVFPRTRFGREWRACADDMLAASLMGVDPRATLLKSFALAAALAGFAGFVMTAYYGGVGYGYGLTLGLKALAAAVLGGIGSVGGAFLGGLALGFAEAAWSALVSNETRDLAVFVMIALLLALRPEGILGWRDPALRP